jgi:hypothetical protein
LLRRRVFDPLGLSPDLRWDLSPEGINSGGNGLWCTSRDLLRLGILHLQDGQWQGRQILSHDWVRAATGMQVRDVSLGVLTGEVYLGPDEVHEGAQAERREGYGFQWWRGPHDCYSANGLFGQNCFVFPNERAVIAVTAGMDDEDSRLKRMIQEDLRPALGQWRGAELAPRVAGLDLLPSPPSNLAAAPDGWQGLYLAGDNDQGVTGIRLALDGATLRLGIEDGRGQHEILAGLGHRQEGMTTISGARLHHAYEFDPPGARVSAWATWSAAEPDGWSCLTLDCAFVETAFRDTLRLWLRGAEMRLEREVNVNSSVLHMPELKADRVALDCPAPAKTAP